MQNYRLHRFLLTLYMALIEVLKSIVINANDVTMYVSSPDKGSKLNFYFVLWQIFTKQW